jgi:hypothetical protein
LPAHTMYSSKTFFMHHVWLLSNIISKTKDHLTDSQFYGPNKIQLINWKDWLSFDDFINCHEIGNPYSTKWCFVNSTIYSVLWLHVCSRLKHTQTPLHVHSWPMYNEVNFADPLAFMIEAQWSQLCRSTCIRFQSTVKSTLKSPVHSRSIHNSQL